jgi:hypothetical protein
MRLLQLLLAVLPVQLAASAHQQSNSRAQTARSQQPGLLLLWLPSLLQLLLLALQAALLLQLWDSRLQSYHTLRRLQQSSQTSRQQQQSFWPSSTTWQYRTYSRQQMLQHRMCSKQQRSSRPSYLLLLLMLRSFLGHSTCPSWQLQLQMNCCPVHLRYNGP